MHDAVDGIRDRLADVLWIGGGPCAGKSTVARLLAAKYGLRVYDLDSHYATEPRFRSGRAARWWGTHTFDERWLEIADDDLLERSVGVWEEQLPLAIDELCALAASGRIIVEGPGALPWLVARVLCDVQHAVFLVPEQSLRDRIVAERERAGSGVPYWLSRNPAEARSKHRERDRRLGLWMEKSCHELGLRCIRVSHSTQLESTAASIEQHFAPRLGGR